MTNNAARVRKYLIHNFLFDDESSMPPDEASLLRQGIIDSTGVLDLLMFVEDEFGITVADEDVKPDNFDSIDCIVRYIESKTAAAIY